jgi:hypothetical protein
MIELFQQNWVWVAGTISALIAGLYVPVLRGVIVAGFRAMLTEKIIKMVALSFLQAIVKSTKNKLDDAWFDEFKKAMEDPKDA